MTIEGSDTETTLQRLPDGTEAILKMKDGTERRVTVSNGDGDVVLSGEDSDSLVLDLTEVEDVLLEGSTAGPEL